MSSTGGGDVSSTQEVMNLSAESLQERQQHEQMLMDLKAKERAATLVSVPTLPNQVREALRAMGLPVRLFGENLANVRDRLRYELAKQQVYSESEGVQQQEAAAKTKVVEEEEEQVTKYTRASQELVEARQKIALFSLERSKSRLAKERTIRLGAKRKRAQKKLETTTENDAGIAELDRIDEYCLKFYKSQRQITLQGSQYGEERPLSAICAASDTCLVATGGWSGSVKLWDGSSSQLSLIGHTSMAHEDRITGVAMTSSSQSNNKLVATASIDLTGKLFKIVENDVQMETEDDGENNNYDNGTPSLRYSLEEVAHLKGHAARLCKVAFHPTHAYVGTSSYDHTWRLWDVETSKMLLLQDGHWKETYGIGFHPDGSLCATTDLGGVIQVWDLRTGKSIGNFLGHAKRVLCSDFSPNGFHLATAGDDGTIKVWDLRKRKKPSFANIPAHSNLISQLRYNVCSGGESLVSASFDGTAKVWSTRDYKMLSSLRGHEGKVMGIDIVGASTGAIVTSGYDKTIKFWK